MLDSYQTQDTLSDDVCPTIVALNDPGSKKTAQ